MTSKDSKDDPMGDILRDFRGYWDQRRIFNGAESKTADILGKLAKDPRTQLAAVMTAAAAGAAYYSGGGWSVDKAVAEIDAGLAAINKENERLTKAAETIKRDQIRANTLTEIITRGVEAKAAAKLAKKTVGEIGGVLDSAQTEIGRLAPPPVASGAVASGAAGAAAVAAGAAKLGIAWNPGLLLKTTFAAFHAGGPQQRAIGPGQRATDNAMAAAFDGPVTKIGRTLGNVGSAPVTTLGGTAAAVARGVAAVAAAPVKTIGGAVASAANLLSTNYAAEADLAPAPVNAGDSALDWDAMMKKAEIDKLMKELEQGAIPGELTAPLDNLMTPIAPLRAAPLMAPVPSMEMGAKASSKKRKKKRLKSVQTV
jgi:hypothetical protein